MMRFFGLAVVLAALSACATQTPRPLAPTEVTPEMMAIRRVGVPFQAVPQAGYCPLDESDIVGAKLERLVAQAPGFPGAILGIFRPCRGPVSVSIGNVIDRLLLVAYPLPPAWARDPAQMDRQQYLTIMGTPEVTAQMSRWVLGPMVEGSSSTLRTDQDGMQYLGTDGYGVYNGFAVRPDDPELRPGGNGQVVLGYSLVGDHVLMVIGLSAGIGTDSHSRDMLRRAASDLLRTTIIAAERPGRAKPAASRASPGGA